MWSRSREIEPAGLPVPADVARLQPLDPADHVLEAAEAELRHQLAHLLGHEVEEAHHVVGLPGKLLAQHRVLRGDADRTGVQVADAHQDAAEGHQRRGREAELVGAEQGRDHDVAPGLEAAVGLHADPAAQVVLDQRLLGLRQTDLPGRARVLDRGERRGAGAAVVAADQHAVGLALGHARRDGADAALGHQLHADVGAPVRVLQVVDQLGQVLDRVDVVVRRRRDQADARRRVARLRDRLVDLVAGQLPAFAGLGALRDLDLQLVGVDQIPAGHAEAPRRHLLDRAALRVAVRQRGEAARVLAALAGVALAADPVHRDRQRLVRVEGDRAVGHRAGAEAAHDARRRLDLLERHRLAART